LGTTEYAEHTESRLRACLKTRGLKQNYVRAMTNCRRFTAIWTALTNLQPIHRFSKRLLDRASAQGRVDYVRVRLFDQDGVVMAEPILGKSGLIHTMVKADGLIAIGMNTEGLDQGAMVDVMPL